MQQLDMLALLDRPAPVAAPPVAPQPATAKIFADDDFARIYGNEVAKRALEIALVDRHPILLIGPEPVGRQLLDAAEAIGWMSGAVADAVCTEFAHLYVEIHEPRDCDRFDPQECSAEIRARVEAARPRIARWPKPRDDDEATWDDGLAEPARKLLEDAVKAMRLDDQAVARAWLVARSIAALADVQTIGRIHIAEALSYMRMPPTFHPAPLPPTPPILATRRPEPEAQPTADKGREVVPVDPKRLDWDSGDIRASYSADTLANHRGNGSVRKPFKFRGGEWVSISGGSASAECFRLVAPEAFDGPTAPYGKHEFHTGEQRERFGGYHGMTATHGSREVVLQGPPVVFVAGKPEQAALL